MGQSNALREQPSMDEILASIRRIIDAGESKSRAVATETADETPADTGAPVVPATVVPAPANDAGTQATVPVIAEVLQNSSTEQLRSPTPPAAVPGDDVTAAIEDYLASEKRATVHATVDRDDLYESERHSLEVSAFPEPDLSEIEAALEAEFNGIDRNLLVAERRAKYGSRFSDSDNGAFQEVASLLRGSLEEEASEDTADTHEVPSLMSSAAMRSVTQSFSDLSQRMERTRVDIDSIAEEMLRPMLQEWLDNNLPSLVERLVRAEIERIARGEPRSA